MPTRPDRAFLALAACVAGLALGHAIDVNDGRYAPQALPWLTVALIASFLGVTLRPRIRLEAMSLRALPAVALSGLVWQAASLLLAPKVVKFLAPTQSAQAFALYAGIATLVSVGLWALRQASCDRMGPRTALCIACVVLAIWVVRMAPDTFIDVRMFHDEALKALMAGDNPYAITMRNIYPSGATYAPGFVDNHGRLLSGYVYPPVNLLLGWFGYVVGDVRYALGAAWVLTVWMMSGLGAGTQAVLAAALFALTPRGLLVLEMAWIEPFVLLFTVAVAMCAMRGTRALPWAMGMFAVSKQYTPLLAATGLLLPAFHASFKAGARRAAQATAWGLVVTLPFVLWSPSAFYRSAWLFHSTAGLRFDALNYVAWWSLENGRMVPDLFWGKVLGVLAVGWSLQRAPTTVAGMAMAMGFSCLVMMSFNNVAFCNYYWFIIGCFFTAMAASVVPTPQATPASGGRLP